MKGMDEMKITLMLPLRLLWYWQNRHWYNLNEKMPMWLSFIISSVPIYALFANQSALLPIAYLVIAYTYSREYTWSRFQSGEYPLLKRTPQPIEGDKPKRKEKRKHEGMPPMQYHTDYQRKLAVAEYQHRLQEIYERDATYPYLSPETTSPNTLELIEEAKAQYEAKIEGLSNEYTSLQVPDRQPTVQSYRG